MGNSIDVIWGPIRSILEKYFSFGETKEILGLAGLNLAELSEFQQKLKDGSSKSQLMSGIDALIANLYDEEKKKALLIITEEILKRKHDTQELLDSYLRRLGWNISKKKIIPLNIFDISDLDELPENSHDDFVMAVTRMRDGDLSGAQTSVCGAIDTVTSSIYRNHNLGDPSKASFKEKINVAYKYFRIYNKLETELAALNWQQNEIKPFIKNLSGSINQAANIMQTLRAKMSDTHGSKSLYKPLVYDSLKWAALILRMLKEQ